MACFHPRYGYRAERGLIRRNPPGPAWRGLITLACGQCIGCRAERKRQWGVRGMHELQMSTDNDPINPTPRACFLTLTYADDKLPNINGNLDKRDWQLFAKKLRAKLGKFRYIMCGEYGSRTKTERCHFHAIIYGHDFSYPGLSKNRIFFKKNDQGNDLFISPILDAIWTHGHATIGSVSFDSVCYVAGYIQKKVNGKKAKAHYTRTNLKTGEVYDQVPEFALMSRNKGIGRTWIEKYYREVYPADNVLVNGKLASPPDYYDRWYAEHYPDNWKEVQKQRVIKASKNPCDNSPERLAVRKKVFTSKHAQYSQR